MADIVFKIHWLSITVFAPYIKAFDLYNALFRDYFGELIPTYKGGYCYRMRYSTKKYINVYINPIGNLDHFHIEIKGSACDLLSPEHFRALYFYLNKNHRGKFQIKRIDLAFDNVLFTPLQVYEASKSDAMRTLAKRGNIRLVDAHAGKNDDGSIGSQTLYIGTKDSTRMVRIYNKRGPTRCEFVIKDNRSDFVARQIFSTKDISNWGEIAQQHLMDYVEFDTDWWKDFVGQNIRANYVSEKPINLDITSYNKWLLNLAVAISILFDCLENDIFEKFLDYGRRKRNRNRNRRYYHFLSHKAFLSGNMSNLIDESLKDIVKKSGVCKSGAFPASNSSNLDEKCKQWIDKETSLSYKPEITEVPDLGYSNKDHVSVKQIENSLGKSSQIIQESSFLEIQEK